MQKFLRGLKQQQSTFVYFAYEDVFCSLGYEITPLKPLDAYVKLSDISKQDQQLWIINSCTDKNQTSFYIKRWSDMCKDLETVWPQYFDIKDAKKGVQDRPDAT